MPLADIETIVVVMMENRSFDHMLGYLSLPGAKAPMPVEGLRNDPVWLASKTNYQNGDPYPIHPLAASVQDIPDPPHDLNAIATQIGTPPFPGSPDGLGGFAASYAKADPAPADLSPVMGYYPADAVPVFDFFARNFAVCDHWFSALPTGTQANRLMAMSGESAISDNASFLLPDQPLVYDWLNGRKIGWCAYQSGDFLPFFALMPRWLPTIIGSLAAAEFGSSRPFRRYEHFAGDWAGSGPLPPVIFIEPEYTDGPHVDANDDHPPTGIAK
ncbi:MAG TPA: alkaline phosphatase family protein, partial [Candidatus Cybelea sp.]|nr:alkaline phosphatase family protein [Candidatus Cybelea sp.]